MTARIDPANALFHALNEVATPKGRPAWGSPEWHREYYGPTWKSVSPSAVFDINALDPLNGKPSPFGYDEQAEHIERDLDYSEVGGMK